MLLRIRKCKEQRWGRGRSIGVLEGPRLRLPRGPGFALLVKGNRSQFWLEGVLVVPTTRNKECIG